MAKQVIGIGTTANDGTGDPARTAFGKVNDNFTENYDAIERLQAKGTDIASATTTDIGAATGDFVHVTGTTTITGLGTITAGRKRIVRFAGILTLTHNATSLILPTGANITTAANDVATFVSEGSGNWRCTSYTRANGTSLAGTSASFAGLTGVPTDNAALVTKFADYVDKETFTTVTFDNPLVLDCGNKQNPLLQTTATGDTTLGMSNVKSGGSGILKILTATASAVTITFDASFTNESIGANTALTTYPLPAGTGKTYFLQWLAVGTTLYWAVLDGSFVLLSGDVETTPLGVATIQPNAVTYSKINSADKKDLVVTNSTVQAALNASSGYTLGVKTGISDLLAGQIYAGLSDDGNYYNYICVVDGTAYRSIASQPQVISTVEEISQELQQFFTDAGNTGTSETDIFSYTIPASGTIGNLSQNGQAIKIEYAGLTVSSATATRQLKLKFGGTTVFDSTALTTATGVNWVIRATCIRVSASVVRCYGTITWGTVAIAPFYTEVTGLTLSSTNILVLTGQAASTGAATNDIVGKAGTITFKAKR